MDMDVAATAGENDILNLHGVFMARLLPHILDCPQADVVDQQKMPTVKRGFWGPLFRGWRSPYDVWRCLKYYHDGITGCFLWVVGSMSKALPRHTSRDYCVKATFYNLILWYSHVFLLQQKVFDPIFSWLTSWQPMVWREKTHPKEATRLALNELRMVGHFKVEGLLGCAEEVGRWGTDFFTWRW